MKAHYAVENGKVATRSLEAHIVDHCNLRCAACCSLSPHLPRWNVDPGDLVGELALAKRAVAPTWFKLVGGEPLLHPRLLECIEAGRASGIAQIVSVTTNGFLLPRQPVDFWRLIDALTISVAPILLGEGIPVTPNIGKDGRLDLREQRAFKSGMVQLSYAITK
jgi:sulfatase maturation enzyme AslB (radical SAM superfamily)